MSARVLRCADQRADPAVVARAVEALAEGAVAIVPTDSVMGIACVARAGIDAHRRIFELKGRERTQALPLLIADGADLERLGESLGPAARALADALWPGSLTLVVRASEAVPGPYRAPNGTVGLRVPDSDLVRAIIRAVGAPLACTSANLHGEPAVASLGEVSPSLLEGADLAIDAGRCPGARASTVVDVTVEAPLVLRKGALGEFRVASILRKAGIKGFD